MIPAIHSKASPSLAKQLTLKELNLSRFSNNTALKNLVFRNSCKHNPFQMGEEMKKILESIPVSNSLCDLTAPNAVPNSTSISQFSKSSLSQSDSNASSHNYTMKFHANSKSLPSYFKRQTGLSQLFPNRTISTYLAVTQHTLYDQSVFNPQTYAEREVLSRNFVAFASLLVQVLKLRFNKWADFIDPSSGTGFFEEHSHGGFVSETDEIIAKQAGLQVRDLGCCRVLASLEWGTKVWLGSFVSEANQEEIHEAIQMIASFQK